MSGAPREGRRLLALAGESLISYVSFFKVHWKEQMLEEEEKPAGIYEVCLSVSSLGKVSLS